MATLLDIVMVLCISLANAIAAAPEEADTQDAWDRYRLPDTLSPVAYNVTLWPRLEQNDGQRYIFQGHSEVLFQCLKETDLILIHCSKLHLYELSNNHMAILTAEDTAEDTSKDTSNPTSKAAAAPAITSTWLQETTQYLVIQLEGKLVAGRSYRLFTEFYGPLTADMTGLYRSHYTDGPHNRVLVASHLQPVDAREVFPCFDEPAMKAVFHITLMHEHNTVALSNGLEAGVVNVTFSGYNVSQTTFEPTKKMSTYLLAFVVADYSHIESCESPVLLRLWASREFQSGHYGDFALNVTAPLLSHLEAMLNITFPLNKYDQVGLPLSSGEPMENWGLVTYRELLLGYHGNQSSHRHREWLIIILAHELVHTWFGNLVTLSWWSDLWLNEAFATYLSYVVSSRVMPDMDLMDMMLLHYPREIMEEDSKADSRPLSYPPHQITSRQEMDAMFSQITYSKGALVLHMLCQFLTEEVFMQGLRTYLKQHLYSTVTPDDLWRHLQDAVDASPDVSLPAAVGNIMNRWILQMGFPVVTIDTRTGSISQKHFLLEPDAVVDRRSVYRYEWIVPVRWMKSGKEQPQVWLLNKEDWYESMKMTSESDWVLGNLEMSGYYRVNYDAHNWERLLNQLHTDHQVIPKINRARIIDDAFNLAKAGLLNLKAGLLNLTVALRTTEYLSRETEMLPWEAATHHLDHITRRLHANTTLHTHMQEYLKRLVLPHFRHFENLTANWTEIPSRHTDKYLQADVISLACSAGIEECTDLVASWYSDWMENPENNKPQVYCAALAVGGEKEWDFGWDAFHRHQDAKERADKDMLRALACTRNSILLNRYLYYVVDPDKNLHLEIGETLGRVASNPLGQSHAWGFVESKWEDIVYSYGSTSNEPADILLKVTERFSSTDKLYELEKFKSRFKYRHGKVMDHGSSLALGAVEKAIERTKRNIRWLEENQQAVLEWFSSMGLRG
ncbi:aminopeptidase N-like [Engraulis encrasicolus]|uniref:aminopeptidase N-like n=1 Tax=Engraulis encrasicolus TaxID=184585 RepID=UPI002FD51E8C